MKVSTTPSEVVKPIEKMQTTLNVPNSKPDIIRQSEKNISEMTDEHGKPTEQAYQTAVNKMNEFMEHTQRNSKFIFHSDLERYYVELVDAESQEVVKEIPPKELLDAYYEMQKLAGKIFDTQA